MNVVGTDTVGNACCWKELACPFVLLALLAPVLALLPDWVRKLEIPLETFCSRLYHTDVYVGSASLYSCLAPPMKLCCSRMMLM